MSTIERAIRRLQGEPAGEEEARTGEESPASGQDAGAPGPPPADSGPHVNETGDPAAVPCPPGIASL
ncbi:MAG: hypothetical protein D6786_01050, partial [Gammaproteobacteria bacterium]